MSLDFISTETIEEFAQHYGYWAVFLGILLENIGIPIPGETVTLAGGFLAGNDQLSYWLVLGNAVLGATLGGNVGYWVGRYGGWPLLLGIGRLVRIEETRLVALRDQFSENATKAVFLGRFVALLRIFASPLAGIAQMPYLKFLLYNTLGALAWAVVMVSLSYFAGQFIPLDKLVAWASQFALLTLLIVLAWLIIPFWLESRKAKQEGIVANPPEDSTAGS
ncbi:DedA family protein [Leptodesmis sichuanensis]|uniref:DedA family protein n=1 Tax=Leptodesmis sichuanensis TaxID=2906798 RepID=UPI001F46050A|nr:DedA family protein [Leptodesmis sichuanensis]UIE37920.1 DedA family protein [Leptodesmis sichuanensis A121]